MNIHNISDCTDCVRYKGYNPTLKQLQKIATALDSKVVIKFLPIDKSK